LTVPRQSSRGDVPPSNVASNYRPIGVQQAAALLHREVFRTSRTLEFCSEKELTNQTGHPKEDWPLVALKELVDNALDACEEAGAAPEITIRVSTETGEIIIVDNGPGIPPETVKDILDYTVRVSSREAYVSPTRGAQGNALKTLIAMPFALDGNNGEIVIEARGVAHMITFAVDQLRQVPVIDHVTLPSPIKNGTRITVAWPDSACSILVDAERRFLQIADDFGWLNPHLRIRVAWNGVTRVDRAPSNPAWKKWRPYDPTPAHWYDLVRFERYVAAHVGGDQDRGEDRTVREFVSNKIRGFTGTAKQKIALGETGMARAQLSSLFGPGGESRRAEIESLLDALKRNSKPVKPQHLGLIGKDHLFVCFEKNGAQPETFKYYKSAGEMDGLPGVVEVAFGWCPKEADKRRIIVGVNWSVGLGNPFRSFRGYGGEGLERLLGEQQAQSNEPVIYVLHYACPRVEYTDRGKSALVIPGTRQ
jgi:DNA topoisomerase VI subunit B